MELATQAVINGLMLGAIYALVGLGLTLVFGVMDLLNFAYGQMLLVGGYAAWEMVNRGVPFGIAIIVSIAVVTAIGIFIQVALFRRIKKHPIDGLIVSIGLIGIFHALLNQLWGQQPQRMSSISPTVWHVGDVVLPSDRLTIVGIVVCIVVLFEIVLHRSRLGRAIRAAAQHPEAAMLVGIRIERIDTLVFAVGGALAAVAGGLIGTVIPVEPILGESILIKGFIVVILGGAASPIGTLLGGVGLGMAESVAVTFLPTELAQLLPLTVLVVVLALRPEGIVGSAVRGTA